MIAVAAVKSFALRLDMALHDARDCRITDTS
jgi:hypothetical protein